MVVVEDLDLIAVGQFGQKGENIFVFSFGPDKIGGMADDEDIADLAWFGRFIVLDDAFIEIGVDFVKFDVPDDRTLDADLGDDDLGFGIYRNCRFGGWCWGGYWGGDGDWLFVGYVLPPIFG